jgi:hypothetical protein
MQELRSTLRLTAKNLLSAAALHRLSGNKVCHMPHDFVQLMAHVRHMLKGCSRRLVAVECIRVCMQRSCREAEAEHELERSQIADTITGWRLHSLLSCTELARANAARMCVYLLPLFPSHASIEAIKGVLYLQGHHAGRMLALYT